MEYWMLCRRFWKIGKIRFLCRKCITCYTILQSRLFDQGGSMSLRYLECSWTQKYWFFSLKRSARGVLAYKIYSVSLFNYSKYLPPSQRHTKYILCGFGQLLTCITYLKHAFCKWKSENRSPPKRENLFATWSVTRVHTFDISKPISPFSSGNAKPSRTRVCEFLFLDNSPGIRPTFLVGKRKLPEKRNQPLLAKGIWIAEDGRKGNRYKGLWNIFPGSS